MKKILTQSVLTVIISLSLVSCMTVAPVNQHYERAATLGKGNFEASGSVSMYESEGVLLNKNYGFRGGYGISDKVDLKIRYEKRVPEDTSLKFQTNYVSVIPKFNIVPNQLSIVVPVSRYEDYYHFEGKRLTDVSWSISPQMIRTYTNTKNTFDFSILGRFDYLLHDRMDDEFFLGLNLGAGLSTDLNKWSVRPELGLQFKPHNADYAWSYGIGVQFIIPGFKSR